MRSINKEGKWPFKKAKIKTQSVRTAGLPFAKKSRGSSTVTPDTQMIRNIIKDPKVKNETIRTLEETERELFYNLGLEKALAQGRHLIAVYLKSNTWCWRGCGQMGTWIALVEVYIGTTENDNLAKIVKLILLGIYLTNLHTGKMTTCKAIHLSITT